MATYAHLTGDLDASPELLERLDALARKTGQTFTVTSGHRTYAEQAALYRNRAANRYPVAAPGTSRHETGQAADVTIGGRPIQHVIDAGTLRNAGLAPLAGDAVHVELAQSPLGRAAGAVGDAAGAVVGAVTGAAGNATEAAAKGAIGALWGAAGQDGTRALLYVLLVALGAWLAVAGLMRATGADDQLRRLAETAAAAAATKGTTGAAT